jgi:hypothetical protein
VTAAKDIDGLYTAMRFAACSDDPGAIDAAFTTLHDELIRQFPEHRRGPVEARIYQPGPAIEILDLLREEGEPIEDATLRAKVHEFGLLVVVTVKVSVGAVPA